MNFLETFIFAYIVSAAIALFGGVFSEAKKTRRLLVVDIALYAVLAAIPVLNAAIALGLIWEEALPRLRGALEHIGDIVIWDGRVNK